MIIPSAKVVFRDGCVLGVMRGRVAYRGERDGAVTVSASSWQKENIKCALTVNKMCFDFVDL